MCGRVRAPNVEEVSEIRLKQLRSQWWREALGGDRTPGKSSPVIISEGGERIAEEMRWGLIPAWSESDLLDYSTYNARSERISETATYRGAWRKGQRCLIPAEGFYERKHFFSLNESGLMMLAGLWDEWKNPIGGMLRSYTIITTEPNELVGMVHNRMPVIIGREHWTKWLGEKPATEEELKALLRPYPATLMEAMPPLGVKSRHIEPKEKRQLQLF
ncbi:SOS response-associated peptidase [Nostoc sp. XA013]|nr:SOS response-associated peptidase [Nostoc sp. XA013]